MLLIQNVKLPVGAGEAELRRRCAKVLGVPEGAVGELRLVRQSIDARKKADVHLVCSVQAAVEKACVWLRLRKSLSTALIRPRRKRRWHSAIIRCTLNILYSILAISNFRYLPMSMEM